MKILQIIPRFNPLLGGGVNVVFNFSKFLSKRGHEVTIITTDWGFDENYANIIEAEGVEVLSFRSITNMFLFIPTPKLGDWLSKNIKNYDIVHLNGARSYQNIVVHKYAKKHNIPYVLQAHGSVMRIVERQKLKKIYDQLWGYKIFSDSSKVIALTYSEGESYERMGINKEKIEFIPNGIDLSIYDQLPQRGGFREKHSIGKNERIILYLGRLHKSKSIDLLIEAFSGLIGSLNNAILVLVGPDDGYKDILIEKAKNLKIEDKLILTGPVSENEKVSALIDSDVFVTPRFYGFPITFVESCACGLPIVTTNGGDDLDWINNTVGYVTNFDVDELEAAILKILTDRELELLFRENCKAVVREKFTWELIAKNLEAVYRRAIDT